jgi:iron(III) transport system ATP-binding protein
VLRRRFLGEVDLVEIAVQGLDTPLLARMRNAKSAVPGTDVMVVTEPGDVLVFPRLSS